MPAELTSFVGRLDELEEIRQLLKQARLLTLAGPGGVGKSRLALRAATEAAADFPDGVRLAELSGLKDPDLLPGVVAEALGLPARTGRSPIDSVIEHVADAELLLVLDTCEHLVDACALLADLLLSQAPGLKVLATSRQALDIPGEYVLPVTPLGLPEGGEGETRWSCSSSARQWPFPASGSPTASACSPPRSAAASTGFRSPSS